MTTAAFEDDPKFDERNMAHVTALADAITRMLRLSRELVGSGRMVDLTGLDRAIGLLCAKALDLQPEFGRALRPRLAALLTDLDRMATALDGHPRDR